jgi:hypothetical protein
MWDHPIRLGRANSDIFTPNPFFVLEYARRSGLLRQFAARPSGRSKRSCLEDLTMRHTLFRYLTTLLCMLAAGTWMLPVHALAAPMPLPIMASEVEDDLATMSVIAAELNDWIESGSFRTGLRSDSSIDLDGDGVPDTVFASSVDLLGDGGSISVLDGATGALRFTLGSPRGERGFGSKVALVGDCDADACRDIVVVSGLLRAGELEIRYRLVSGMSGKLIALKTDAMRTDASADAEAEQPLSVAGDANHDREVDASDIALAIGELGILTTARPALDLDCDGQVTVVDVVGVAVDRGDGVVFRRLHATDTRLCRRAQCLLLRDRLHHGGRGVQACSIHCRVCRTSPAFGGSAGIL